MLLDLSQISSVLWICGITTFPFFLLLETGRRSPVVLPVVFLVTLFHHSELDHGHGPS